MVIDKGGASIESLRSKGVSELYLPLAYISFLVRLAARRLHESNLFESSSFAFNVIGSLAYHHMSCYLATLDLNTLSNLNIPNFFLELIGIINANLYSPERRLRRLVERYRIDSSQSPPKGKRNLFEGHKRPENKLRNQFLDLIYSPDDFNIYIYQSHTKNPPSLRERKKITT
ncbi:hypothetical protein TNCV_1406511 [Trichonephila clavipes]|nr:hypothetical protein TNCV_1406511 [Trichonephila clavipes]